MTKLQRLASCAVLLAWMSVPLLHAQQSDDPFQDPTAQPPTRDQNQNPSTSPNQSQLPDQGYTAPRTQPYAGDTYGPSSTGQLNPPERVDNAGLPRTTAGQPQGVPELRPEPPTPFQTLVERTIGRTLPLFGRSLFRTAQVNGQGAYRPLPDSPPPTDYIVSTGDQVLVRMWGSVNLNEALTVDRAGNIYLPQVGIIHLAGLPYSLIYNQIEQSATRVYRNFNLSVNLGALHSIQVFVTGEAERPGSYTISSLSTLVNAVFASAGPSAVGSLRRVELHRGGETITTFDFYDLLLHGDKSRDAHLLPGDVIFIPPVGPEVAVSGEVKVPAIYELKTGETLKDAISFAGGLNSVASGGAISLEQIVDRQFRETRQFALDSPGGTPALSDGDLLIVSPITHRFENTVTIRGNLANPGRFSWHPGMKLSEILPEKASLLTEHYWDYRNAEGRRNPFFEPAPPSNANPAGAIRTGYGETNPDAPQTQPTPASQPLGQTEQAYPTRAGAAGLPGASSSMTAPLNPNQQPGAAPENEGENRAPRTAPLTPLEQLRLQPQPMNRVDIPAPEIDWSYAVIERTDRDTLKEKLLPFQLGRLVLDHDPSADLPLEPGDVVVIFSQDDFRVAEQDRTKFVRVEGEVGSAGIYSVRPGETLQSLVARAGGLSPQAYLFGSQFTRTSTRVLQQQRLDEYINRLSVDMDRSTAQQSLSIAQIGANSTVLTVEERLLAQLRSQRATGRIVLNFKADSAGLESIPPLTLENGDTLVVPSRPAVINVIGSVSTQSSFLFEPGATVKRYLALAGGPDRASDPKHAFLIRANGAVVSRQDSPFLQSSFGRIRLAPGDTLIVPSKLFTASRLRTFLDSSTAFAQLGVIAATLAVATR